MSKVNRPRPPTLRCYDDGPPSALTAQTVESVAATSGGREMRETTRDSERPVGGLSRIVCSFSSTYRLLRRVVVVRDCDEVRIYLFLKTEIRILNDDEFNIRNCWYGEMKHGHLLSMDEA